MRITFGGHKRLTRKLDDVLEALAALKAQGEHMTAELTALQAEVARNTEVDQSAITLLQGLSEKLEELKNDPAAIQALADELKGSSDALAEAVVANTPAAG